MLSGITQEGSSEMLWVYRRHAGFGKELEVGWRGWEVSDLQCASNQVCATVLQCTRPFPRASWHRPKGKTASFPFVLQEMPPRQPLTFPLSPELCANDMVSPPNVLLSEGSPDEGQPRARWSALCKSPAPCVSASRRGTLDLMSVLLFRACFSLCPCPFLLPILQFLRDSSPPVLSETSWHQPSIPLDTSLSPGPRVPFTCFLDSPPIIPYQASMSLLWSWPICLCRRPL